MTPGIALLSVRLLVPVVSTDNDSPPHITDTQLDSVQQVYLEALSHFSTPKLKARQQQLRSLQQRGYSATLERIIHSDGLEALMSYIKVKLQIEFSLPHEQIMVDISAIPGYHYMVGLDIDWTFPEDPWRRE